MDKSRALVPRRLEELDKSIFRLVRRWKLFEFPIPLAMRFRFKLGFISFDFTLLAGYNQESTNAEVIDVPTMVFESSEVLAGIKGGPSKGYKEREELRLALADLTPERIIRLTPADGESMRKLKRMVTEAGKDIDKNVKHIEDSGDLLVFIPAPKPEGAPARGRPKKVKAEEES